MRLMARKSFTLASRFRFALVKCRAETLISVDERARAMVDVLRQLAHYGFGRGSIRINELSSHGESCLFMHTQADINGSGPGVVHPNCR
jgi:hypothetical protein